MEDVRYGEENLATQWGQKIWSLRMRDHSHARQFVLEELGKGKGIPKVSRRSGMGGGGGGKECHPRLMCNALW